MTQPRGYSDPALAQIRSQRVVAVMFIELDFPSGFTRVCSATYAIDWNGHTWLGAAQVGSIEAIQEGASLESRGIALTLSGVPQSRIGQALNEQYQGRDATVWFAVLDPDTYQVLFADIVFKGQMDVMTAVIGQTGTIRLTCESRIANWNVPRIRRHTTEDQALDYPGDLFYQYQPAMAEATLSWGPPPGG